MVENRSEPLVWAQRQKTIRKMPKSPALSLSLETNDGGNKGFLSHERQQDPRTSRSPGSPPMTGHQHDIGSDDRESRRGHKPVPIPPRSPTSPPAIDERAKSFFGNYKGSKSSTRLLGPEHSIPSIRQVSESSSLPASSNQVYQCNTTAGSATDFSRSTEDASILSVNTSVTSQEPESIDQRDGAASSKGQSSQNDLTLPRRPKDKHRFPHLLSRSKSTRTDESLSPTIPTRSYTRTRLAASDQRYVKGGGSDYASLRTAPIDNQVAFKDILREGPREIPRNHSAERHAGMIPEDDSSAHAKEKREPFLALSSSFKDGGSAAFFSNIRSSSTKAADGLGKAGRGIFGKLTRSGSAHEKEAPVLDENYICKVINLPLVQQTRRTRISKKLAASKDKTEFWMPALPWRCIDYLNMNGCEEEGLYRVPGSGKDVKYWQMRFDKELDINLFDEPDLYDINIIGSMFKAWLRELPDEIFPKATQARIADQCKDAKSTPQLLKDELSKLPPFNYYLLFAITCHISLLHSCSEKNRMDYRNLCICFQPCMKIDAFCFQFLVLDWRNCWQGCWTEKEFLEEEMRIMEPSKPPPSAGRSTISSHLADERAVSSGSSRPSLTDSATPERHRPPPHNAVQGHHEQEDDGRTPTQAGHLRINNNGDYPKLSPMKPLSPIGPI